MLDIMKLRTHENSVTVTVHEKNKMKKLTHSMPENLFDDADELCLPVSWPEITNSHFQSMRNLYTYCIVPIALSYHFYFFADMTKSVGV